MEDVRKVLRKQGNRFVGKHSVVKICRWTKKSLVDEGVCYKEKFYGIKSHRCCQMSCFLGCQNSCVHCWRPIEIDFSKDIYEGIDEPSEIIDKCIEEQRKLLEGFRGNDKVNLKKFKEAQEPNQFALSLIGESILYPKICELIKELNERGMTSFLVTNGLSPSVLEDLRRKKCLPTQLYISLNASNKKLFDKWHKSRVEDAWKKFNESLEVMSGLDCRRVLRMTLVKDLNMSNKMIDEYVELIDKASPDFIEIKGFMSVGFSRKRLGYDKMPRYEGVKDYACKVIEKLENYELVDEHRASAVVLVGRKN